MKRIVLSLAGITLLLVVANIILACQLVSVGKEVKFVDQKIEQLKAEEISLSETIASHSSLLVISQRAAALGFVPVSSVMTIHGDKQAVAMSAVR